MLHSVAVHFNPLRPGKLIKGYAFITFRTSAAAQSALTSIINGVWANNSADPLCLAKTRMIVTPVTAAPPTARAKLSVSSLSQTVDEATLASAFSGCSGFCGQQVLCDYNPFGSIHYQKNQGIHTCAAYGKAQTGPLGRAFVYFETASQAVHALKTINHLVIHGTPIRLQRPRNTKNGQTKPLMQPTKALNPAAPPFFPAAWASKKVAVTTFPDQMAIAKIAAHRAPFRPLFG